jgi:hypothetical protein
MTLDKSEHALRCRRESCKVSTELGRHLEEALRCLKGTDLHGANGRRDRLRRPLPGSPEDSETVVITADGRLLKALQRTAHAPSAPFGRRRQPRPRWGAEDRGCTATGTVQGGTQQTNPLRQTLKNPAKGPIRWTG